MRIGDSSSLGRFALAGAAADAAAEDAGAGAEAEAAGGDAFDATGASLERPFADSRTDLGWSATGPSFGAAEALAEAAGSAPSGGMAASGGGCSFSGADDAAESDLDEESGRVDVLRRQKYVVAQSALRSRMTAAISLRLRSFIARLPRSS
jgi:hypothetical protein